jgi:sugar lactone lactonase YvrE
MAWQPGGRLLAFFENSPRGEIQTLDPETGEQRQIAATGDFGKIAWSPDGRVVATSRSPNIIAIIDPRDARQVASTTASGVPIVWLDR